MTNETATEAAKKEPKGFKRNKAFEITQKNWNSETNSIDLKKTVDEIAEAIGVNFGGAKSYFAFFAKEEHRNFIIPGLKTYWETELKGSRVNGTAKKSGETKDEAPSDGDTKVETKKKAGGSEATRKKLSDVLKNRKARESSDKLLDALKNEQRQTSTEPSPGSEKIAA